MKVAITLLLLLVVSSGYFINESFAEISENQLFLLEGSGFAVTEESIKISEIDLSLLSQQQHGSTIDFLTIDGFITLDDDEFLISNLEGKFLREGRFIRISGNIESTNGIDTSISFFGRLVEESKDALVYGFTGRITTSDDTFKIIYTTKLSTLSEITSTSSEESNNLIIHIIEGSSLIGGSSGYVGNLDGQFQNRNYFSEDSISIEPGTTITIINDDTESHNIISGVSTGSRWDPFTPDGRISTGEITPGQSVSITFDDAGFYRLYDPNYTWMRIIAYVFEPVNSESLYSR